MNNKINPLAMLAWLALAFGAGAQEITHEVDFPKGDAVWSVVYAPRAEKTDGAKKRPAITGIEIERSGSLRRDSIRYSDGSRKEQWWGGSTAVLLIESSSGRVIALPAAYAGERRFDESSFGWLGQKTFIGTETYSGVKCQHYEEKLLGDGAPREALSAWIDAKTHRPVALNNGFATVFFKFSGRTPGPLSLPAKFQTKLQQYEAFFAPRQKPQPRR